MFSGDYFCFPRPKWGAMRRPGSSSDWTSAVADVSRGSTRDESPAPSSNSGYSCVPGDSEASDTELSSDERPWAPRRRGRKPCKVPAIEGEPGFTGPRSTNWNNRADVGNCGVFFGNWGQRTQQGQGGVQRNIDAQIKKNPCMIIGLTECEAATEQLLRASAVADAPASAVADAPASAVADAPSWEGSGTLEGRPAFQYFTIRGEEQVSCLLGCRTTQCAGLESLSWTRKAEGMYKSKGAAKAKMKAYTRLLVGKIRLKTNVGGIGKELRVAVCHLHFQVANKNKGFRKPHQEFWLDLVSQIQKYEVQVLMGDFNMSLFRVVPELRSNGVHATLISWFPWKAEDTGEVMVDSCGIFSLTKHTETVPSVLPNIWADDIKRLLPQLRKNAGPGQTLETYLPKEVDGSKKIHDSLEPLPMTIEEEDETESAAVAARKKNPLKWKGKTLDIDEWKYKGTNHKGSHFPLAAWSGNQSRRSEEAFIRRANKQMARQWGRRPQYRTRFSQAVPDEI